MNVDDGIEGIKWIRGLSIGGEGFCQQRPMPFSQTRKKVYFLPSERDR